MSQIPTKILTPVASKATGLPVLKCSTVKAKSTLKPKSNRTQAGSSLLSLTNKETTGSSARSATSTESNGRTLADSVDGKDSRNDGSTEPSSSLLVSSSTPPSSESSGSRARSQNASHKRRSLYNGPQLAEPCVADALVHILQPCGHKVLTSEPEACGANCLGSGTEYANERSTERYICAVCISRSVREHYGARRTLFMENLDRLEQNVGGFQTGWKAERLARMEAVWESEAIEQLLELSELGRRCMAISVVDDFEFALTAELTATPALTTEVDQKSSSSMSAGELPKGQSPSSTTKTPVKASRLPMPATSKAGQADHKTAATTSSRLPLYRRK